MKLGIVVPQGLNGEFAGWPPERAWARILAIVRAAEDLGVESIWVFDHVGTFGTVRDEPTFEAFGVLGGIIATTTRVRVGPLVARAGLRNAALLAKQVSTLDVISGGRFELGLGAAAPAGETVAYGYPLEPFAERVKQLRETLAVVRPLLTEGRATVAGSRARAENAIDNPRGLQQPRIPLIVGGNSLPTIRVAADFADELNLDGPSPAATTELLPVIASACRDVGRDPASLAVSVHLFPDDIAHGGAARARRFAEYADTPITRIMALVPGMASSDEPLASFVADARAAGVELS
jgi:alkanesulfonate monooxygenase SsuD/methylene tetrahydromethanopterin reductase-like flavin-dependent oxidoreductase (luciferase family)